MREVKQECRVCGGESFTTAHGMKVCDQCGQQEEHFVELLSQEAIGEVDRSRLLTTRYQEHEDEPAHPASSNEKLNNWTTYEAYNVVLHEWTKALLRLGASPTLEAIVFKLWVAYLQRMRVAFVHEKKSFSDSVLKNNRDRKLIYEKAESVSSKSLHSYSSRRRKKKVVVTKLDKIKDRIERKKLKNFVRNKQESSFMNTTLTSELSKSVNEFEASMLSEANTSCTSSHAGDSRINMSARDVLTSGGDESSCLVAWESGSEEERQGEPLVPRKQVRRDNAVRNWIKQAAHIYSSGSEAEEEEEEEECHGDEGLNQQIDRTQTDLHDELEDDIDADLYSEITLKKSSSTMKKPSSVKSKKYKYNKFYKKAVRDSTTVTSYRSSRLPFIMGFSKLLGLLYLAVLLAEEDILLSDIIRWCREGHIPYFSAPYLLPPGMELGYYDLIMLRNAKKLPDAQEIQVIAGRLAVFLSIQCLPLPPVRNIIRKFVKLLNLPDQAVGVAEGMIELVDDMKVGVAVPPVESMAMACIILTLKAYCGLDSSTEVLLSSGGAAITAELPTQAAVIPFSWQDWQRHMCRVLWVCGEVDPPTALHLHHLHDVCYFNPSLFSKYFWREDMWRIPRSSWRKKAELQILTEELLQHQGLSLEEVMMQPPVFPASRHPLRCIIEHLTHTHHIQETKELHKYIKIAEELTQESFANQTLDWFNQVEYLVKELHKCGSKIELRLFKEKKKTEILCEIQSSNYAAQGKNKRRTETTRKLVIPNPLQNMWKMKFHKATTWNKVVPSLPSTFKWLVCVGSHICEAPQMQLLSHVNLLQNKVKKL